MKENGLWVEPEFTQGSAMHENASANTFSKTIELDASRRKVPYMDSLIQYCEANFIEPEEIAHLVNRSLKSKIESEMRDLNFLPRKAKLDL